MSKIDLIRMPKDQKNLYLNYRFGRVDLLTEEEAIEETLTNGNLGITFDNATLNGISEINLRKWQAAHPGLIFIEKEMRSTETTNLNEEGGKVWSTNKKEIIATFKELIVDSGTVGPHRGSLSDLYLILGSQIERLTPILSAYHEVTNAVYYCTPFLYKLSEKEKNYLWKFGEKAAKEKFRKKFGLQLEYLRP